MEATFAQKGDRSEERSISRASDVRARQQCFLARRRMSGQPSRRASPGAWSMIRKSGNRFSEKIMLKQRDEIMIRSDHDLVNLCAANGPPLVAAGQQSLHNLQANIHVAAGVVGIWSSLVCLLYQSLCVRAGNPGEGDVEFDIQAKATGRARSDAYGGGHRRIGGHFRSALRSNELHRANEAGGISGGEKLFGIVACAAAATQFLRCGEFDVQRSIERSSVAIPAAGSLGAGSVKHIY